MDFPMGELREWVDPYEEARKKREAAAVAFCTEPLPPGGRSRQHAMQAGMLVYAFCMAGTLLLIGTAPAMLGGRPANLDLFHVLYCVVPPAAAFGAAVGHGTYQLAAGRRQVRLTHWAVWIVGFLCLWWIALPFFFQQHRTKRIFLDGKHPGWFMPAAYAVMIGALAYHGGLGVSRADAGVCMIWGALASLFLGESLVVNLIVGWLRAGRLYPPASKRMQFSLGTLLGVVFLAGGWVSGLVLIFRR